MARAGPFPAVRATIPHPALLVPMTRSRGAAGCGVCTNGTGGHFAKGVGCTINGGAFNVAWNEKDGRQPYYRALLQNILISSTYAPRCGTVTTPLCVCNSMLPSLKLHPSKVVSSQAAEKETPPSWGSS